MNREIKFRIRDGESISDTPMCHFEPTININDLFRGVELDFVNNDFKRMQYTGLKDMNGKDIYEGDILEYINDEDEKEILIVKYDTYFVGFVLLDGFMSYIEYGSGWHELEIIGNIYENPDMLEPYTT